MAKFTCTLKLLCHSHINITNPFYQIPNIVNLKHKLSYKNIYTYIII